MKNFRRNQRLARRLITLSLVVMATASVILSSSGSTSNFVAATLATYATRTSSEDPSGVVFTCPDGRMGLHVIHMRFLVNQAKANPVFTASRLALLQTFLIPSLKSQTSHKFVLQVAYDEKLPQSTMQALKDALEGIPAAHIIYTPQQGGLHGEESDAHLNFNAVAAEVAKLDPRVSLASLYLMSRIDADDAAHVGSIVGLQKFACDGRPEEHVRVSYLQDGQMWFPDKKQDRPYGMAGVWKTWKVGVFNNIYKHLAIMQTLVLSGRDYIRECPLDVYSFRHYEPADLVNLTATVKGCAMKVPFKPASKRYNFPWHPPEGDVGNLYVQTASGWTWKHKLDHKHCKEEPSVEAWERSFGISRATLASMNVFFTGMANEAPKLLEGPSTIDIE